MAEASSQAVLVLVLNWTEVAAEEPWLLFSRAQ